MKEIQIMAVDLLDPVTLRFTIISTIPIILAALGGVFSERSGVINIALEGIMLTGAWSSVWFSELGTDVFGLKEMSPWLGFAAAAIFGMGMASIHAVLSIEFEANQVVSGVAINLLGLGFTTLMTVIIWGSSGASDIVRPMRNLSFPVELRIILLILFLFFYIVMFSKFLSKKIPKPRVLTTSYSIGRFSQRKISIFETIILVIVFISALILYPILYPYFYDIFDSISIFAILAAILVIISHYVLFHTPFGLRVRSVGEHPRAAATLGINVKKTRYICVIASGFFAGIGGAFLSIGYTSLFTQNMTTGRGFIALAAVIFGKWTPIGALSASLLFGLAQALQLRLQGTTAIELFGFTYEIPEMSFSFWEINFSIPPIPNQFFLAFPFIVVIIIVAIAVKRSTPPKAIGQPYKREG